MIPDTSVDVPAGPPGHHTGLTEWSPPGLGPRSPCCRRQGHSDPANLGDRDPSYIAIGEQISLAAGCTKHAFIDLSKGDCTETPPPGAVGPPQSRRLPTLPPTGCPEGPVGARVAQECATRHTPPGSPPSPAPKSTPTNPQAAGPPLPASRRQLTGPDPKSAVPTLHRALRAG